MGKLHRNLYTISKRKNLPATTNIEASGANLGHNLASGLNPHLLEKFYYRTFNRLVKIARICVVPRGGSGQEFLGSGSGSMKSGRVGLGPNENQVGPGSGQIFHKNIHFFPQKMAIFELF